MATYERTLITPNARFDKFLRGDRTALSPTEQQSYQRFKSYGCVACHQGINIGGNLLQRFGVFPDPSQERQTGEVVDRGRYESTHDESDWMVFRVPSLRNVAETAPYFHDGRAATLEDAVRTMARVQLGRSISPEDLQLIVQFLGTLTGEYRGHPVARHRQPAQP